MAREPQARWKNANTLLAIIGLFASAIIFYTTRDYPQAPLALGGPPGFYPRVLAVILASLSLAVFIEGWLRPVRVTLPSGSNLIRLLAVLGLLAIMPLTLEWLGFRVMGILVALGAMLLLSDWRKMNVKTLVLFALVAITATFALFFIFESVARVPLPRGRLF